LVDAAEGVACAIPFFLCISVVGGADLAVAG
jgi:hypothetical protein